MSKPTHKDNGKDLAIWVDLETRDRLAVFDCQKQLLLPREVGGKTEGYNLWKKKKKKPSKKTKKKDSFALVSFWAQSSKPAL